jgi:acetyltransferase-like isoleucine patch superfamily enzyme
MDMLNSRIRLGSTAVVPLLRWRGAAVASGVMVSPLAHISEAELVSIGSGSRIGRFVEIAPQGGSVAIGRDCSLNNSVVVYGAGGVTIGDNCRIASGAMFIAFNHSFADPDLPITSQGITCEGITLGSDIWVGARAIVLDGVTIGMGAVVGAGSVVTKDVAEGQIIVGNPARGIGFR